MAKKNSHQNVFGSKGIIMTWMSKPGPTPQTTDEDIVTALKAALRETGDPMVKTSEIANRLNGIGEQHCRDRLSQLEEGGLIDSKRFGSGRGWFV